MGRFHRYLGGDRVAGIDALIRRKEYGPPYDEPQIGAAPEFEPLPANIRTSRKTMLAGVEAFQVAMTGHAAPGDLADNCRWFVNGQDVGACAPAFGGAPLAAISQIRESEVLAVDEPRGLVVARLFEDLPAIGGAEGTYPKTQQVVAVFRFGSGRIEQVHAFTTELAFGMKPHR